MEPKIIRTPIFFEILKEKLNENQYDLIKTDLEKSFYLWHNCDIELSISQCIDRFNFYCNQSTSKPCVLFRERIKEINCEYVFGECVLDLSKDERPQVFIHILISREPLVPCNKKPVHDCISCLETD